MEVFQIFKREKQINNYRHRLILIPDIVIRFSAMLSGLTAAVCFSSKETPLKVSSLTSAGVGELGPPQEAQVPGPGPNRLSVAEAEPGAEMVRLQNFVSVDGEVTAGVVAAVHPNLQTNTTMVGGGLKEASSQSKCSIC